MGELVVWLDIAAIFSHYKIILRERSLIIWVLSEWSSWHWYSTESWTLWRWWARWWPDNASFFLVNRRIIFLWPLSLIMQMIGKELDWLFIEFEICITCCRKILTLYLTHTKWCLLTMMMRIYLSLSTDIMPSWCPSHQTFKIRWYSFLSVNIL